MKKKVWILNHYATAMFFNEGGRHYWFAKELKAKGYEPVIFCCNTKHNGDHGVFFDDTGLWKIHNSTIDVPFVVIKSTRYVGNGKSRIRNMLVFARNLIQSAKQYAKEYGKPDIILASSVHPFTVFAGEKLSRYFKVPCICEIRDLWPESIFAYYPEKRNAPYAKLMVAGEKKMYKDADAIIMTWAGGAQYIKDMGWSKEIPDEKVFHICNGVDLSGFEKNVREYKFVDEDLANPNEFKVVYTGAIRLVNKIDMLVDVARILEQNGNPHRVKILIWGDGDKIEEIREAIKEKNLNCISLKGKVSKQYIPSILTQGDCCLLQYATTELDKFGQSQNKLFEYLASGKPVLMTYSVNYSIIKKYKCGIELEEQTPEAIAAAINKIASLSQEEVRLMSVNARSAAEAYDFKNLTEKLERIIEAL